MIGSTPYPSGGPYAGVAFLVWAPHAVAVNVSGDFNHWSPSANPLTAQGSTGFWCADVPGATVAQRYKYVIHTADHAAVVRRDPGARLVTSADLHDGASIVYDPTAYVWHDRSFAAPSQNTLAIYELYIGTFNSVGDKPGTFWSALQRLGAIRELGFNAVEVLPVTQFDGIDGNPYGPTDQFAVDDDAYGGPDGFKAFVDACHRLGMAVIVDVVHNHWGPFDLATYQFDGTHSPDNPAGIYFYDVQKSTGDRGDSPWGPRPDYSDPVVQQYVRAQIAMWFDEYHADGLRWDSVSNVYNAWNGGAGKDPHTGEPGAFLPDGVRLLRNANVQWRASFKIAEDLSFGPEQSLVTQPIASGGLGFDAQWNATLAYYLRKEFPSAGPIRAADVVAGMSSTFNGIFSQSVSYVESHNELTVKDSRLYQLVDPSDPTSRTARKKAALAAALLFTSPQVPLLYQGDEFLDPSWFHPRSALDWNYARRWAGIRLLYADLVHLRTDAFHTTPGLTAPGLDFYEKDVADDVLTYDRYAPAAPATDDVIVVANLSSTVFGPSRPYTIGLPYGGEWHVAFNSDSTMYSSDFGGVGPAGVVTALHVRHAGQPYSATLQLGDYSVVMLSRRRVVIPGAEASAAQAPGAQSTLRIPHGTLGGLQVRLPLAQHRAHRDSFD